MNYVEPRCILSKDLPLIVFSDNTSGWLEFLIKFRTNGAWNHIMWMRRPWYFVSQGNAYSEIKVERYMKKGNRLKFVEILGLAKGDKELISATIQKKLNRPWWRKRYDYFGIVGQAMGINWINTPWLDYCSEDAVQHLKIWSGTLPADDERRKVIQAMGCHMNPQQVNEYFQNHPNVFKVYGEWSSDEDDDNKFVGRGASKFLGVLFGY